MTGHIAYDCPNNKIFSNHEPGKRRCEKTNVPTNNPDQTLIMRTSLAGKNDMQKKGNIWRPISND